jgi:hypothetical protein
VTNGHPVLFRGVFNIVIPEPEYPDVSANSVAWRRRLLSWPGFDPRIESKGMARP